MEGKTVAPRDALVHELVDRMIGCWNPYDLEANRSFYVDRLVPQLMADPASTDVTDFTPAERAAVRALHAALTPDEWRTLPELVSRRIGTNPAERAALAREARAREKAEAQRAEAARVEAEAAEQASREELRMAADRRISAILVDHFLEADRHIDPRDIELITQTRYVELRRALVRSWAAERGIQLDDDQAGAVASESAHLLVGARAGSGKTRTLVARTAFLQQHCGIQPQELLLLAFNRKAADEMKARLRKQLGEEIPHVMTFHALAYALVHPDQELVYDDPTTDQLGVSREIQRVIDDHIRRDDGGRIRDLMLRHYRDDWERIVAGGFDLPLDELREHRRALPRETIAGDYVKSFGEKVIANALFEHDIDYRYERSFRWSGVNYRPDFTIPTSPKSGIVIEYFGMHGDPDYDEQAQAKRAFWAEKDEWTLLEFTPADIAWQGVPAFIKGLLQQVGALGLMPRPLSDEEIWARIKDRAIDAFTRSATTFVGRCRTRGWTPRDARNHVRAHVASQDSERLFIEMGIDLLTDYMALLERERKEDFSGLVWRATSGIGAGHTRFTRDRGRERGDLTILKHVLIDEFQDFSPMFHELVRAIGRANLRVWITAVGDDWQAINGFAGSDLRYFENFSDYFPGGSAVAITTNYRSARRIVTTGNALMSGHGDPAVPHTAQDGRVDLCQLDRFRPSEIERDRHGNDAMTPALLRLIKREIDGVRDVVLLSRTNSPPGGIDYAPATRTIPAGLDRFLEHVRSFLPEEDRRRVTASTVHKYKGLEQSAVIVLDAVARRYPLVHPTWHFFRVFGEDLEAIERAERRLFYVALTRAVQALAIVTETADESPFLDDIRRHTQPTALDWEVLAPMPSADGQRVEIRVYNAYDVRENLKQAGFRFEGSDRSWRRAVPAEGFSRASLATQPWNTQQVRVEIHGDGGGRVITP